MYTKKCIYVAYNGNRNNRNGRIEKYMVCVCLAAAAQVKSTLAHTHTQTNANARSTDRIQIKPIENFRKRQKQSDIAVE